LPHQQEKIPDISSTKAVNKLDGLLMNMLLIFKQIEEKLISEE